MKTQLFILFVLLGLELSEEAKKTKLKRGSLLGDYSLTSTLANYPTELSPSHSGWQVTTGDFNLDVNLPPPRRIPSPVVATLARPIPSYRIVSNSLNKPVMEGQEYVPPQTSGTAFLPQMPPPAIPVNAVASNIPASRGAVFLGSGSLGVVALGNGAYALGSGSLGYSENRAQPRPTTMVPVYPPLRASPNLLPAAVPTPAPAQPPVPIGFGPGSFDLGNPIYDVPQVPQIDQNGYEYLPPNRVGFGQPLPPRPLRPRQQFATPTALQLPPINPQIPSSNDIQFTVPIGHSTLGSIPTLA